MSSQRDRATALLRRFLRRKDHTAELAQFRDALTREVLLTERLRVKAVIITVTLLVAIATTLHFAAPSVFEPENLLREALNVFYDIREVPGLKKKPSTSELLDWLKLLVAEDIPLEALQSKDEKVSVPPLVGALLKNEQDVTLFEKLVFMQRHNR